MKIIKIIWIIIKILQPVFLKTHLEQAKYQLIDRLQKKDKEKKYFLKLNFKDQTKLLIHIII